MVVVVVVGTHPIRDVVVVVVVVVLDRVKGVVRWGVVVVIVVGRNWRVNGRRVMGVLSTCGGCCCCCGEDGGV